MLLNATLAVTLFPVLPFLLPSLSGSPNLLLGMLGGITLALGCSTAYLQSATFALASLWGSQEVLAVMSGQGGIAVLVSAAQLILALVAAFGPSAPVEGLPDPSDGAADGTSGVLAGVGLWALAAAGTSGCFYALRELRGHNEFANVMLPHSTRLRITRQERTGPDQDCSAQEQALGAFRRMGLRGDPGKSWSSHMSVGTG